MLLSTHVVFRVHGKMVRKSSGSVDPRSLDGQSESLSNLQINFLYAGRLHDFVKGDIWLIHYGMLPS